MGLFNRNKKKKESESAPTGRTAQLLNEGWQVHPLAQSAAVLLPPDWKNLHADDRFRAEKTDGSMRVSIAVWSLGADNRPTARGMFDGIADSWRNNGFTMLGEVQGSGDHCWQLAEMEGVGHALGVAILAEAGGTLAFNYVFTEVEDGQIAASTDVVDGIVGGIVRVERR